MPVNQKTLEAVERVQAGESIAAVSRSSDISRSTLFRALKKVKEGSAATTQKRGPKTTLPAHVEQDIVTWIGARQQSGWSVDRSEIIAAASQILSVKHQAPQLLGRGWYKRFSERHRILTDRLAQNLSKGRNSVTREGTLKYFYELLHACLQFKCTASDIFNVDETSFKTKTKSKKVVAIRGSRSVHLTDQSDSYHLSIVVAAAADGTPVPPAFILPGQSCDTTILDNCPVKGAMVTTAPKAFMTANIFDGWLEKFGEWKLIHRDARPAVLVMDNCSSHFSPNTAAICHAYGILLVYLPPNSTHLFQPLDVAVFRSFKRSISKKVSIALRAGATTSISRSKAISIAGSAFNTVLLGLNAPVERKANKQLAIVNGFRACGAWPLSLPKLLMKLSPPRVNAGSLQDASWIRTVEVARNEVLTVPSLPQAKKRKRVTTRFEWHTRDGLHHAASVRSKK
ncbi:hypothetical protein DYB28_013246 [Aphanomyces astaci]|uniref:HTH CENPB-type domain-containing protein n=1 Tax=Aphanomyces astaci TaxID=112090 RepID=A0A9X8EEE2_APHAT|nr:hypothetical protein DYB28_013246 [Aphanomyces astaci]